MKVLFVSKHGQHDNADEDAVTHALRTLGHEVICIHELPRHRQGSLFGHKADFCLFFKWENVGEIRQLSAECPLVFWYFDLISSDDPTLARRMDFRRQWFNAVRPYCKLCVFTDGDWVNHVQQREEYDDCRWLMQGMDSRVAGIINRPDEERTIPILFTGTPHHGAKREQHIAHLREKFQDKFHVLGEGGPRRRFHGERLKELFSQTKIVIAPDGPCTDYYWSNRVFLTLGLGGFLIHPYCLGLLDFYSTEQLCYYTSRESADDSIERYMDNWNARRELMYNGYIHTISRHTYTHRCKKLIEMVQEVL